MDLSIHGARLNRIPIYCPWCGHRHVCDDEDCEVCSKKGAAHRCAHCRNGFQITPWCRGVADEDVQVSHFVVSIDNERELELTRGSPDSPTEEKEVMLLDSVQEDDSRNVMT